jgi:hypothetical protein
MVNNLVEQMNYQGHQISEKLTSLWLVGAANERKCKVGKKRFFIHINQADINTVRCEHGNQSWKQYLNGSHSNCNY